MNPSGPPKKPLPIPGGAPPPVPGSAPPSAALPQAPANDTLSPRANNASPFAEFTSYSNGTLRNRNRADGVGGTEAAAAYAVASTSPRGSTILDKVGTDEFEWTASTIGQEYVPPEIDSAPVRPQIQRLSVMYGKAPDLSQIASFDEMMPPEEEIDVLSVTQSLKDEFGQPNIVRLYEVLGRDIPDFKTDFNVRIAIYLRPQDAKPFTEYRNRIHPSCVVQEIITNCIQYIRRKGWQPNNLEVLSFFGLYFSSDESSKEDEIMMNPRATFWRFGFPRNSTTKLTLKPRRVRLEGHETLNLMVSVNEEDKVYRNLNFYASTTVSKLIQSLQTRYPKEMESKEPPYYGLFLYRGKKGNYVEDLSKTLSECGFRDLDVLHWKRRQLVEFCVEDDPVTKFMVPLDTTVGEFIAQIMQKLNIPNPQQYAATRTHGRAEASRADLYLIDQNPMKTYRLSPGDGVSIQKRQTDASSSLPVTVAQLIVTWTGGDHNSTSLIGEPVLSKRYTPLAKKLGEVGLFQTVFDVSLWDGPRRKNLLGDLHFTNYRIIFSCFLDAENTDYHIEIPLTSVHRFYSVGGKKNGVEIECKDFRTLRFHCGRGDGAKRQILGYLEQCLFPNLDTMFAFFFKDPHYQSPQNNGWTIFDHNRELHRMGVGTVGRAADWRITCLNLEYKVSPTYPAVIAVPSSVSDDDLMPVFKYRSKGRIPALSWIDAATGAAITRCSQPLVGIAGKSSPEDAMLISAIRESAIKPNAMLHLVDARPKANAVANKALGGGFESAGGLYQQCDIEFCNIDNIHVMRSSLSQLKAVIELVYENPEDATFWSKIESTGWLNHLQLVLRGASKIVSYIRNGESVCIHCSDGWDRTSQLSALAMLSLDPYYRTLRGFAILIEKEWLAFGHKFSQRLGHIGEENCDKQFSDGERAPVFIQFVDCIWQLQRQHPLAFEFNEVFLLSLIEHAFSCHFGTFLFNCERERQQAELPQKTESFWSWMLDEDNKPRFTNPLFTPTNSNLTISAEPADVVFWNGFYRRWYSVQSLSYKPLRTGPFAPVPPNIAKMVELKNQNEALLRRIAELEQQNPASARPGPAASATPKVATNSASRSPTLRKPL